MEAVAENDEALMEKYLEGEEITRDELKAAIRKETIANTLVPVVCGSSYKNKGVQKLLDAIAGLYARPPPISRISRASILRPRSPRPVRLPTTHPSPLWPSRSLPTPSSASWHTSASTRQGRGRHHRLQLGEGLPRAHGPYPADALQPPQGYRLLLCRRYRGCCGPEEHHHRRHPCAMRTIPSSWSR